MCEAATFRSALYRFKQKQDIESGLGLSEEERSLLSFKLELVSHTCPQDKESYKAKIQFKPNLPSRRFRILSIESVAKQEEENCEPIK